MGHKPDKNTKYRGEFDAAQAPHDYDVDFEKREIYLMGREEYTFGEPLAQDDPGVDYLMANRLLRNIRILQSLDAKEPILIHMKTRGGDWMEGIAIYQAICACPNHVTILNYGAARSMSSIIFQAADQRLMLPYSWFMMHEGDEVFEGTEKQVRSWHKFADRAAKPIMFDIYARRMAEAPRWAGKTKRQIVTWIKKQMNDQEEVYLTAHETVELGLADAIFGENGEYDWESVRIDKG